jgi:hypothetical protein
MANRKAKRAAELCLSDTDAAYLAGIMDGEGSITLVRSHAPRTRGRYVYPLVRIANTDRAIIDWVVRVVPLGAYSYRSAMNERCKDVHHIGWASNDAIAVLREILPFLVAKRNQAEIVLSLWAANEWAKAEAGGYFGNGHPVPDWLMARREEAFAKVAALNVRGVNHASDCQG